MNEETKNENTGTTDPERIPRPEEIVETYEELPENQRVRPLRCRAGSKMDNPCPRDATTWLYPGDRDYPLCDEHARANDLYLEAGDRSVVEDITGDWLRIAKVWGFEDLEQLAVNAHESAKEELLKAEARADLAREIADAARKGTERPNLTPEQNEEIMQLVRRSDAFNNAYTALEDAPEGTLRPEALRGALATLAEERDKASEEVSRYREELGIRPAAE